MIIWCLTTSIPECCHKQAVLPIGSRNLASAILNGKPGGITQSYRPYGIQKDLAEPECHLAEFHQASPCPQVQLSYLWARQHQQAAWWRMKCSWEGVYRGRGSPIGMKVPNHLGLLTVRASTLNLTWKPAGNQYSAVLVENEVTTMYWST